MTATPAAPGAQRVAAFLLSLDPKAAERLLQTLEQDVVVDVARSMLELDSSLGDPDAIDGLRRDLALAIHGRRGARPCDEGSLEKLLSGSLGKTRSEALLAEIRSRRRRERPFLELESYPGGVLAALLSSESPALQALVLSYLDPHLSAEILGLSEVEHVQDVVRRMAELTPPGRDVLPSIAADLAQRAAEMSGQEAHAGAGERLQTIADLLKHSSPDVEKSAVEAVGTLGEELAAQLRELLFTWEDIASIDKRAMQKILATVDIKTLAVALKACSAEVEANVMSNLSSRVQQMVGEERDLAGAVALSEVESARNEIMKNIRALIESGEFRPSRKGEDLVS